MAQGFLSSLDLKGSVFGPEDLLVTYQNGNVDGSFVLHYLVGDFVKTFGNQSRILLVLSSETVNHWNSVGSKLGWNFGAQQAKGHLKVIDLGEELFQTLTNSESPGDDAIDLEKLYTNSRNEIESMCGKPNDDGGKNDTVKVLIVVEDLTSLLFHKASGSGRTAVSPERQVLMFLKKLLKLNDVVAGRYAEVTVATLVNSCGTYFASTIGKVLAAVAFEVSPLQTGYSELFSGYLVVKQRPASCDKEIWVKSYQYKLDDRQIKLSPLTKLNF